MLNRCYGHFKNWGFCAVFQIFSPVEAKSCKVIKRKTIDILLVFIESEYDNFGRPNFQITNHPKFLFLLDFGVYCVGRSERTVSYRVLSPL